LAILASSFSSSSSSSSSSSVADHNITAAGKSQLKKVGRENLGFFSLLFLNLSKTAAEKNRLGCEVFLQGFAASSSVML
jgi:hypothetical protein